MHTAAKRKCSPAHRCEWNIKRPKTKPSLQIALTVITALEMEHAAALGGSRESIAAAKAGIVKLGGIVVTARQPVPGFDRALREALDTRSPHAVMHAPEWHAVSAGTPVWEHGMGALLL
jgi:folylpolyglutamate synthase/dihydropteroate synthase